VFSTEASESLLKNWERITLVHIIANTLCRSVVSDSDKMADRPKGYGMTAELADKVRLLCSTLAIGL